MTWLGTVSGCRSTSAKRETTWNSRSDSSSLAMCFSNSKRSRMPWAFVEKPRMEGPQVGGEVVGVALELLERELRRVVEGHAADAVEDGLEVLDLPALQRLVPLQYFLAGLVQHAVEPAQDGERQDDLAVVRLLVVTAQQVRGVAGGTIRPSAGRGQLHDLQGALVHLADRHQGLECR